MARQDHPRHGKGSSQAGLLWLFLILILVGSASSALYASNPGLFASSGGSGQAAEDGIAAAVKEHTLPAPEPVPTIEVRYPGGRPLDPVLIERLIITYTNEVREEHGLQHLQHDPAISEIARAHSATMVDTGIFSHTIDGDGPTERALTADFDCRARMADGSFSYGLAENIAKTHRVNYWQGRGVDWERLRIFRANRPPQGESSGSGWKVQDTERTFSPSATGGSGSASRSR